MPKAPNSALDRLAASIRTRLRPAHLEVPQPPRHDDTATGPRDRETRRRKRDTFWLFGMILTMVAIGLPGLATDGELDSTFSDLGTFRLDTRPGFETVRHTIVLPGGESRSLLGGPNVEIIALDASGGPDLSYSDDGRSIVSLMGDVDPRTFAVLSDGGMVVAGTRYDVNIDADVPWIARLDEDGSLDLDFDPPDHLTPIELGAFNDVHVDGLGRVTAVGNLFEDVFVIRLTEDGAADTEFANDGALRLPDTTNGRAVRGAVEGDAGVIVTGATPSDEADVFVLRLTPDGEIDSGFGTQIIRPLGDGFDERPSGIVIDANGRIVLAGFAESFTVEAFVIRLLPSGGLDPSLGGAGVVPVDALPDTTTVGLAIDPAHRILVSGNAATDPGNQEAFLARLMPNGRPDASFGTAGYVIPALSDGFDSYRSVAPTMDGRIVVGGLLSDIEPQILVSRYEGEIPDVSFADDDTSFFEGDIEAIANAGITLGCDSSGDFCPNDPVTRGQMAAFLVRAMGYVDGSDDDLFIDDDTSVFETDINRLATAGVTLGCDTNGNFCPNDPVTRGQMAAFLVRAFGFTAGAGDDLFIDDNQSIFEGDIDRLARAGITQGCDDRLFCPSDAVTRGQMAAFLNRALGLG